MRNARFLKTLRSLAEAYHAFGHFAGADIRALGFTPAQFDVIATLGNTPGMPFKALGATTLITKGTLTGVVDRLERRGLVRREAAPRDGRSTLVRLTPAGEAEFERVFPAHADYCRRAFEGLEPRELDALEAGLDKLRRAFEASAAQTRAHEPRVSRPAEVVEASE